MRPEKVDRLATVIILTLTGLVGLVLFALLAYLLLSGIPHISWHFLTSSAESFINEIMCYDNGSRRELSLWHTCRGENIV